MGYPEKQRNHRAHFSLKGSSATNRDTIESEKERKKARTKTEKKDSGQMLSGEGGRA